MIQPTRKNDVIITRNKRTGEKEIIKQFDIELTDWGFHFFVESELDAYKAAYQYRNSPKGVQVEFAQGAQRWMVTVKIEKENNGSSITLR